jgi:hypothetical protein
MKMGARGFSLLEVILGLSILMFFIGAAGSVLKPLNNSLKKSKIINTMVKIENDIRYGAYTQDSYTDLTRFEIKHQGRTIAKHGATMYVKDDFSDATVTPQKARDGYRIITRLEYDPANRVIAYQITSNDEAIKMTPLGVQDWNDRANVIARIPTVGNAYSELESTTATVTIPRRLVTSSMQKCNNGFLRGVRPDGTPICWTLTGPKNCPRWTIPVGYKLSGSPTSLTATVEILCQELNKLSCPSMDISYTDQVSGSARLASLPNFMVLKSLFLPDLFPPRSGVTANSKCERVIQFTKFGALEDVSGRIPASVVAANADPLFGPMCPESSLYKLNPDGSCSALFNPGSVPLQKNATLSGATLNIRPASAFGAVQ